jgi:VanZ family protein
MLEQITKITMRIAFILYTIYLSILLLSQDPTSWIGAPGDVPRFLAILMPIAHLLSFGVLSLLCFSALWPLPRWSILLFLILYGGMTEIIQGYTPYRHPEWADWLQDIGGIVIGLACFWLALFFVRMMQGNEKCPIPN